MMINNKETKIVNDEHSTVKKKREERTQSFTERILDSYEKVNNDMISILQEYAEKKETELTEEERNLLAHAYKNKLEEYRKVLKKLQLEESNEKTKEGDNELYLLEYKELYENQII